MSGNFDFAEHFNSLSAPLPDSGKYLERIGLKPIRNRDRETLDMLVTAHQRSVPFENLDIYDLGLDISISIPDLFDKIVLRRRGGYCFELNAAFMALLRSLGFDCYPVAARILRDDIPVFMPLTHRATIVTIDGVRYFCDVGFGGPSPQGALAIDEGGAQISGGNTFIVIKDERGTVVCLQSGGKPAPVMSFSETPFPPVDFLALNEYSSKNKHSKFRITRVCNLLTETGTITLGGNILKIHSNGDTSEFSLETEDELRAALKKYYGIDADFPLRV